MNDAERTLDALINLIQSYSSIYRGSYLPSRTSQLEAEPGSKILRESVAEHIGLLPLTATFLHPYLVNTVDLGKALIMLSIHDIGEIKVGDVLTVRDTKTEEHKHAERSAALSLLNPAHHALFTEFEAGVSNEAKFASAIDKITPNIYELIVDTDVARARHAHFGFDIHKAVAKDAPLLSWDGFLENFYREVIRKIEMRFN